MSWTSLTFSFLVQPTRTKLGQLYDNCVHVAQALSCYGNDSGSVNAYAITLSPVPAAYIEGMIVRLKIAVNNTGASTVNVNSLGAKTIKKDGADVSADVLVAGMVYTLCYDGTYFQLMSPKK